VAYFKIHLGINNKEMKIRAWSKLVRQINFWPGYKDISCVTDDPNQTVFVR
jgi:hypothetical protein